jgi:glycosyltransferase involved in cell wall biosynthesis
MKSAGANGTSTLRVLALVESAPDISPGQRYRIEQWEPYLRREGIEIHYEAFESPQLREILYQRGRHARKAWLISGSLARRQRVIRHVREFPLVYIFREAALLGPAWFEWLVHQAGVPFVFDFDDAIFLRYVSPTNGLLSLLKFGPSKTRAACRMAAHVTCGNEYLASYARQLNNNVTVIPTTIDTAAYEVKPRAANEIPVIGWTGSHSTLAHLETLAPVLRELARQEKFRLRVISSKDDYRMGGAEVESLAWTSRTEVDDLRPVDIGIMPLPDDPWTRGKCGLKALQFMAMQIPIVCSPVGVNSEIIQHGKNGFLAGTAEEWIATLRRLLHDAELRREIGREAGRTVAQHYSAASQAPRIAEVFRNAAERRTATVAYGR